LQQDTAIKISKEIGKTNKNLKILKNNSTKNFDGFSFSDLSDHQ
jgi:hypothetical protein